MTPPREIPLDAAQIVRTLDESGVDYLIIGGLAVQAHGHVRTTQDADLLPAPDRDNHERLARALSSLNARPAGGEPAPEAPRLDAAAIARADVLTLDTDAGGVDIHTSPPGGQPYEELRSRALILGVAGVAVPFVAKDDLIAMKRKSRRPIDLSDIATLTESEGPAPRRHA